MAAMLHTWGALPWVCSSWEEGEIREKVTEFDLLITLGGDGTILRVARIAARHGVPILGVKMGRLGFLAEMEPGEWEEKLPLVLRGEYRLEERTMLQAELKREGKGIWAGDALNDVVIGRGSLARIVRLSTYVNGSYLTTYAADGLIISTATGSTAYALAVGGPILPPELKNILLVPIAPHLSMDKSILLSEGATVEVEVETDHEAVLTIDGQFHLNLKDKDAVVVTSAPYTCLFVRTGGNFYHRLISKLGISSKI